ncbi:MAG: endopeptidase La [Clostridiales bacterium]|nr:MAG: endopeptidase La [Clostridiales bacterium]
MGGEMLTLPLIPLRGLMIFPNMVLYFDVGREKSVAALEEAMIRNQRIFLTTQKDLEVESPSEDDYYKVGVVSKIKQMLKLPGDSVRVLVEGEHRGVIQSFTKETNFIEVQVEEHIDEKENNNISIMALMRLIKDTFQRYSDVAKNISPEIALAVANIEEPGRFCDVISPQLGVSIEKKQSILEIFPVKERLTHLYKMLLREIEIAELEKDISEKVTGQINKLQKEYFLKEQIRVIQKELGDEDNVKTESDEMLKKLNKLRLKKDIHEKIEKEINKYSRMNPASQDSYVTRNYIEWILELPWNKQTKERIDISHAREVLDRDHYGLDEVKERVLEYLAVKKLTGKIKGPIICLVGPPGVGKTSIAKSIAESVNRKFVRMSLGGVRDEAEIRGHRRTYVGAIPGRVMTNIKEAKSKNPLFLFDEIDKIGNDFRGDPASALLEVLDPEQNKEFVDHYLEVPFDLRKVMFIATANSVSTIAKPLFDRMEIIPVSGYTLYEKEEIAMRYLVPKQLKENGLEKKEVVFSKDSIRSIIEEYTRESGVRELERKIGKICRKIASISVEKNKEKFSVRRNTVHKYLGTPLYKVDEMDKNDKCGVVTGLAWTAVGGETLEIEVNIMEGKGKLSLTGKLGDVMKESAMAGLSYIRSVADKLDIEKDYFDKHDIHVHVPQGAIPKDGPSAGITMATAMISAITSKKILGSVAMTGEITLRGRVLPIGGLKEKLLAAKRYGITRVIIPEDNKANLDDVPKDIKNGLEIFTVKHMDEVIEKAFA